MLWRSTAQWRRPGGARWFFSASDRVCGEGDSLGLACRPMIIVTDLKFVDAGREDASKLLPNVVSTPQEEGSVFTAWVNKLDLTFAKYPKCVIYLLRLLLFDPYEEQTSFMSPCTSHHSFVCDMWYNVTLKSIICWKEVLAYVVSFGFVL